MSARQSARRRGLSKKTMVRASLTSVRSRARR